MLEKYMVSNREFCNVSQDGKITGFQVKVRIPYYRGVFLSMVEDFRVTVDGQLFGPDKIRISLHDRSYSLQELDKAADVHWDFGQWAALIVAKPGGLATGMHTVEVGILARTSYELPRELDKDGLFRQTGPGTRVQPPTIEERYRFTWSSPGSGRAVRKMTLVE
jgi:hypothetical protein